MQCALKEQKAKDKWLSIVLGVIWMNKHSLPLFGIQSHLLASMEAVHRKITLAVLSFSFFEWQWLHCTSWVSELRGCLWIPIHYLRLVRSPPTPVLGGAAQHISALNVKLLAPLSSQRHLLGNPLGCTVSSVSFTSRKKLAWPLTYRYLFMGMLIIPCFWVISVGKALKGPTVQFKTSLGHTLS